MMSAWRRLPTLFSPIQKSASSDDANNEDSLDAANAGKDDEDAGESEPSGRGFEQRRYHKRERERILRYVHFKLNEDPEAYFREQIMLYLPWAADVRDLSAYQLVRILICSQVIHRLRAATKQPSIS